MGNDDKLGALGQLMQKPKEGDMPKVSGEEQLALDAERALKLVEQLAGDDLFDMQVLIEFCAEEIRNSIRDEVDQPAGAGGSNG